MLKVLVEDIDEFVTVIPKAGHRLQLKRVVKAVVDIEAEKDNVCSFKSNYYLLYVLALI